MTMYEQISLPRTSSENTNNFQIIPSAYLNSASSFESEPDFDFHHPRTAAIHRTRFHFSVFFRSFLSIFTFPSLIPSCRFLPISPSVAITSTSLRRKVTGTLFGNRRGHVSFAIQSDRTAEPVLLIEFAVSTSTLVKEMSSGLVRIALECEKQHPHRSEGIEPVWTMYCNGRKCGYAVSRECGELDWHVLSTIRSVSVGAGVIPLVEDGRRKGGGSEGELMYMRARFERVVGNRDSEAFYMLNPDGNGGPELSIFLLRI